MGPGCIHPNSRIGRKIATVDSDEELVFPDSDEDTSGMNQEEYEEWCENTEKQTQVFINGWMVGGFVTCVGRG